MLFRQHGLHGNDSTLCRPVACKPSSKLCPPKILLDELVTPCVAVTSNLRKVDLGSWFKGIQTIMVGEGQGIWGSGGV